MMTEDGRVPRRRGAKGRACLAATPDTKCRSGGRLIAASALGCAIAMGASCTNDQAASPAPPPPIAQVPQSNSQASGAVVRDLGEPDLWETVRAGVGFMGTHEALSGSIDEADSVRLFYRARNEVILVSNGRVVSREALPPGTWEQLDQFLRGEIKPR